MDPPDAPPMPASTTTPDPAWRTRLSFHHSLLSTHVGFTRLYSTCITRCTCPGCSPAGRNLIGGSGTSKGGAIRCQGALGRRREERYKAKWGWLEEWGVGRGMRAGEKCGGERGRGLMQVEDRFGGDAVGGRVEEAVWPQDMHVDGVGGEEGTGVKRRREDVDEAGDDSVAGGGDAATRQGSLPVQANEQRPEDGQGEELGEELEEVAPPASPPPRPPSPKRVKGRPSRVTLELTKPKPNSLPSPSLELSLSTPTNPTDPSAQPQPQPPTHPEVHPPPPPASNPQPLSRPQRSLRIRTRATTAATVNPSSTSPKPSPNPFPKPPPPTHTKQGLSSPPGPCPAPTQPTPSKRKQPHPHPSPRSSLAGKTYQTTSPPSTFLFYRPRPRLRQPAKPSRAKKSAKPLARLKPAPQRKSLILADGELDLDGLIRLCNRAAARGGGTADRDGNGVMLPEGRRWLGRNLRVAGGGLVGEISGGGKLVVGSV
ncbi:hypothetical protein EV426DRAFT_589961 [Tirmania nivea]|nr:hypothetical protein EV426DRAFT_589961 [Tirmania nivea]